ncbi:hypothetical protein LTS10_010862 [Elasticomyces elasticus]|nr:hypothetical protein LTS10_010862 [Elasticomyces elasticus]
MPFTLTHLPTELLEMVATALMLDDTPNHSAEGLIICSLRATCREARNKLETQFLYQYFTSRYLLLEPGKLAELDSIASRPHLADRVKTLLIVCESDSGKLDEAFEVGRCITAPGGVASMLSHILTRFKNLEKLEFSDTGTEGQFPVPTQRGHNVTTTFVAVMLALEGCECAIKTLAFLSLVASTWRVVGVPDARSLLCLSPSLATLEYIDLTIVGAPYLSDQELNGSQTGAELAIALQRCTGLKRLLLRMLSAPEALAAFAAFASRVHLRNLSHFTLYESSCDDSDLRLFLYKHASTLRHLKLTQFNFNRSTPGIFNNMLDFIRTSLHLTSVDAELLTIRDEDRNGQWFNLAFPEVEEVTYTESDEEEEDYVFVDRSLSLNSAEEVWSGLGSMKQCVVYTRCM